MNFESMAHLHNLINVTLESKPLNQETPKLGPLFLSLILSIQAKKILELGCRWGGGTLPLILGAEITGGKVYSVDKNIPNLKHIGGEIPEYLNNYWSFHQSDSIDFLKNAAKENTKYDLIFVDDWHSTGHVYTELCIIDKLVDNKSLILMHDTMHSYSHPLYNTNYYPLGHEFGGTGVYGGLQKFMKEYGHLYEYSTIPVDHGLTILRKI